MMKFKLESGLMKVSKAEYHKVMLISPGPTCIQLGRGGGRGITRIKQSLTENYF